MEEEDRVGSLLASLGLLGAGLAMAPIFKRPQGRMAAELHFPVSETETMNKTLAWLTKKNQGGKIRGVDRKSDPMVFRFEAPNSVYDAIDRRIQQLSEATAGTSAPQKMPQMQASPAVNPVQQPPAHQQKNPFRNFIEISAVESPTKRGRVPGMEQEAYLGIAIPKGSREQQIQDLIDRSGGKIQVDKRDYEITKEKGRTFRDVPARYLEMTFPSLDNPFFDELAKVDDQVAFMRSLEKNPDLAKRYYDMEDRAEALRQQRLPLLYQYNKSPELKQAFLDSEKQGDEIKASLVEIRKSLGY